MKISSHFSRKVLYLGIMCLLLFAEGSYLGSAKLKDYQFVQLDPFFVNALFGVEFDYNIFYSQDKSAEALSLKSDLVAQTEFNDSTDIDQLEDNLITLIGHQTQNFDTAIFGIKQVKRSQYVFGFDDPISWQSPMPFVKVLHQFSLPTDEIVILGLDFLGFTLKLNDTNFDPTHYQLGYANLPIDLLNAFKDKEINTSFFKVDEKPFLSTDYPSFDMKVEIEEIRGNLKVDLIYLNPTYLFHTGNIDFFKLDLADQIIIAQFEEIRYSINIRKYDHHGNTGVETVSEISIGNILNLFVNEALPDEYSWLNSSEYVVQKQFPGNIKINETFSWYQGSDIEQRVSLFPSISFSLLTAQSIGIINGTEAIDDIIIYIDEENRTKESLHQADFDVTNEIKAIYEDKILLMSQIRARDFALESDRKTSNISLIPMKSKSIALNQHFGFSHNYLFLQETSLLRDLVTDCIKRFADDSTVSSQSADHLYNIAGLYLPSAYYIQEFEVMKWASRQIKLNLIQFAVQESSFSLENHNKSNITSLNIFPVILALILFNIGLKKVKKRKYSYETFKRLFCYKIFI